VAVVAAVPIVGPAAITAGVVGPGIAAAAARCVVRVSAAASTTVAATAAAMPLRERRRKGDSQTCERSDGDDPSELTIGVHQ
jgi:3-hydroxyacyl-CoA dehydrogenase